MSANLTKVNFTNVLDSDLHKADRHKKSYPTHFITPCDIDLIGLISVCIIISKLIGSTV